ncbi:hypothetical protein V7127_00720 [Bacillus sp. JJ1773]
MEEFAEWSNNQIYINEEWKGLITDLEVNEKEKNQKTLYPKGWIFLINWGITNIFVDRTPFLFF